MSANKEIKDILQKWADDYNRTCKETRDEYIKTMTPGAVLPPEGTIYGAANKQAFAERCSEYRAQAYEVIDRARNAIETKLNKPATPEAVNTCKLLEMRKSKDPDEYTRLLKEYADTPEVCDTIRAIAKNNDVIGLPDYSTTGSMDALNDLEQSLAFKLTPMHAQQGHTGPGYLSFIGAEIDELLPEE